MLVARKRYIIVTTDEQEILMYGSRELGGSVEGRMFLSFENHKDAAAYCKIQQKLYPSQKFKVIKVRELIESWPNNKET